MRRPSDHYSTGFAVTASDPIELYAGCSRRLRLCELGVSALAAGGILLAGAAPVSTAAWLCLLVAVRWGISRSNVHGLNCGKLMLRMDGSASLGRDSGPLRLQSKAAHWCSRVFCVLTLQEVLSGRRICLIICPTLNAQDDYRRLRIFLRVAAAGRPDDTLRWL